MYIYHALINALSTHMIHINLNTIFYTHVEHGPAKTIYIKYYMGKQANTHTHACTHTRTHTHTHTHAVYCVGWWYHYGQIRAIGWWTVSWSESDCSVRADVVYLIWWQLRSLIISECVPLLWGFCLWSSSWGDCARLTGSYNPSTDELVQNLPVYQNLPVCWFSLVWNVVATHQNFCLALVVLHSLLLQISFCTAPLSIRVRGAVCVWLYRL